MPRDAVAVVAPQVVHRPHAPAEERRHGRQRGEDQRLRAGAHERPQPHDEQDRDGRVGGHEVTATGEREPVAVDVSLDVGGHQRQPHPQGRGHEQHDLAHQREVRREQRARPREDQLREAQDPQARHEHRQEVGDGEARRLVPEPVPPVRLVGHPHPRVDQREDVPERRVVHDVAARPRGDSRRIAEHRPVDDRGAHVPGAGEHQWDSEPKSG